MVVLWTEEEDAILESVYGAMSYKDMVPLFHNRSETAIKAHSLKIGLPSRKKPRFAPIPPSKENTKVCTLCTTEKPLSSFSTIKKSPDGLTARCTQCLNELKREYYNVNKDSILIKSKAYRDENKEVISLRNRNRYEDNKEVYLEKSKQFREKNPTYQSEWREANRKYVFDYSVNYRKKNKASILELNSRYRAGKRRATPDWLDVGLTRDMYMEAEYFQLHVDHIVPIKASFYKKQIACGLHWEGNLQLLSLSENSSKGSYSWPDMWDYSEYKQETINFLTQTKGNK